MNITDLPIDQLKEARWNPNVMNEAMLMRLRESISRFGLVSNLVVRTLGADTYEILSGNQRLQVLNPNPPKDTDGRREESGRGVRELQGK